MALEDPEQERRLSDAGLRKKSLDIILTEDTDSFRVGESVFVRGTMPGRIAYIGETKLGPGDWAGIVLDQPIGKNSGSVGGYHYFQCEPKHGVFSRLALLSRERLGPAPEHGDEPPAHLSSSRRSSRSSPANHSSPRSSPANHRSPRSSPAGQLATPHDRNSSSPGRGSPGRLLHAGERRHSDFAGGCPPQAGVRSAADRRHSEVISPSGGLRVGDRVTLASASGRKQGVLRFLGRTEFADGQWAGVELDEPRGRNDGSVAGTRYFQCGAGFGLFAPTHKVTRLPSRTSERRCSHPAQGPQPDDDGFF